MLHAVKFVRVPKDVAYYLHLDDPNVVKGLRYRFQYTPLIYGITCMVNQMIYIGSTQNPSKRFHKHLTIRSTSTSNKDLQAAITQYGLHNFKVHIFELVRLPREATYEEKQALLRNVERRYIAHFPKSQLYNRYDA
jgi:group I intron endonuclease